MMYITLFRLWWLIDKNNLGVTNTAIGEYAFSDHVQRISNNFLSIKFTIYTAIDNEVTFRFTADSSIANPFPRLLLITFLITLSCTHDVSNIHKWTDWSVPKQPFVSDCFLPLDVLFLTDLVPSAVISNMHRSSYFTYTRRRIAYLASHT